MARHVVYVALTFDVVDEDLAADRVGMGPLDVMLVDRLVDSVDHDALARSGIALVAPAPSPRAPALAPVATLTDPRRDASTAA
jgi:hypothetical protein